MNEYLSANAIVGFMPDLVYTLPYYGEVNLNLLAAAAVVFIGLTAFFWVLRMVVLQRLRAWAHKTSARFDDVLIAAVEDVRAWVYSLIALYAALQFFPLPEVLDLIIRGVFYFAIVWQAINAAGHFVEYFTASFLEKDEDGDGEVDPNAATAAHLVTLLAKIAFWALGGIFVLSNLGIEVTSLIAGLGIGGVAIAFALQGVLGDLFASFSIYFDKPFRIGDFITVGNDSGTVEQIGIKSTRLRDLQGEELVISNAELTAARVHNFKKMDERRIVTKFGITYETPQERVKEVPGIVERIFASIDGARLDRVHFTTFGDSALTFEVVYFVETADYTEYLDAQQRFNFDLMTRFAELGIDFAYPTQTIYTKAVGAEGSR